MFASRELRRDKTPGAACEDLGDIRYQFFNYIQHGAVPAARFDDGPALRRHANANMRASRRESIAATAHFFGASRRDPRTYFSRRLPARLLRPRGPTSSRRRSRPGTDGYTSTIRRAPDADRSARGHLETLETMSPRFEQLHGTEGRALIPPIACATSRQQIERRFTATVGLGPSGTHRHGEPRPQLRGSVDGLHRHAVSWLERRRSAATCSARRPRPPALRVRIAPQHLSAPRRQRTVHNSSNWRYWANAGTIGVRPRATRGLDPHAAGFLRAVMYHENRPLGRPRHNFGAPSTATTTDGYNIARAHPLPYYGDYDLRTVATATASQQAELSNYQRDLRTVRQGAARSASATRCPVDHGRLSDLSGIGRYDIAATMWNYFESRRPTRRPGLNRVAT